MGLWLLASCSPKLYQGKLNQWPDKEQAQIVLNSFDPIVVGKVTPAGEFQFDLTQATADSLKAMYEAEANKEDGIRVVSQTVEEAYFCTDGTATIVNGDIPLMKATRAGAFYIANMQEEKLYGQLRVASDSAFNDTYFEFGKKDFVPGYYIDYFYVHEDASVVGTCVSKTYKMDMKSTVDVIHDYRINLKQGWNMVKIEVVETYQDGDFIRPLKYVMETVTSFPEDAKYILTNPSN